MCDLKMHSICFHPSCDKSKNFNSIINHRTKILTKVIKKLNKTKTYEMFKTAQSKPSSQFNNTITNAAIV